MNRTFLVDNSGSHHTVRITLACIFISFRMSWVAAEESLPAAALRVLNQHCVRCHNADKTRGGLDLSSRETLLQGGATSDAVQPGSPKESPLWSKAATGTMPPERDGRRLNAEELKILHDWIQAGAAWPKATPQQEPVSPMPLVMPLVEVIVSQSPAPVISPSCVPTRYRARWRRCR